MDTVKLAILVGNSRRNIIPPSRMEGVSEFTLLLTKSLFPDERDLKGLLDILSLGTGAKWGVKWIEGPESGPATCRDSVLRLHDQDEDFAPDGIFITASTNLIVAQLRWMCPDSELITLRTLEDGTYLYNLSKEERISKIEPIEPEEYLKIHGIEMERSLVFKGQKIPVDEVSMQKGGSRLSIRWKRARNSGNYQDRYDKKSSPTKQEIGSFVQLLTENCGPSNFEFLLGPSGSTSNYINPNLVKTGEEWWEEE